ncbi:MAG: hypothetical protein WCF84_12165 [Anaerolineae bacterium]
MADSVFILAEPAALSVQPGASADVRVTIHNALDRVGQFQLRSECPDPAWAQFEADQLGVFPGDEESTTLSFQLPPDVIPATYSIALFALTQTGARVQGKGTLELTVVGGEENAGEALPASPVKLTLATPVVEVVSGEEGAAEVVVLNAADEVGQFQFEAQAPDPAWVRFVPDQVGLFPHEQASAHIIFHPPAGVTPAAYPILIRAVSQIGAARQAQVRLELAVRALAAPVQEGAPAVGDQVEAVSEIAPVVQEEMTVCAASPNAELDLLADCADIAFFAGTEHRLKFRNNGGATLSLELLMRGLPGGWFSLSPTLITLEPTRSAEALLTLAPVLEAPPGDYPFRLTADARGDAAASVQLDLMLEIAERGDCKLQIEPWFVSSASNGEFKVHIKQGGPNPIRLKLSGSDSAGGCAYIFPPGEIHLPPFGSETRRLVVRPRRRLPLGESRLYPFTITATALEGSHAVVKCQARFLQRATPPTELKLIPVQTRSGRRPTFTVQIMNPSDEPASFQLSAADTDRACRYEFDPPAIKLPGGGSAQSTLVVISEHYATRPGDRIITFTLHADPVEGLLNPVTAVGQFVQKQPERPMLALSPSNQAAPHSARYVIKLSNPRLTPILADLRALDAYGTFKFELTPTRLQLAPRSQAVAHLNVHLQTKLLPGEARHTHPFRIEAQIPDLPEPIASEGTLVQVVGSPFTPFFFAVVFFILLLLLLVFFFAFQLMEPIFRIIPH